MDEIDWSPSDKYPEDSCTCARCDTTFRSHGRFYDGDLRSRKPCPECGSTLMRALRSEPEIMTLRGPR